MARGKQHSTPLIFFANIAWMQAYEGVTKIDKPKHGGSYIAEHGTGGEVTNFLKQGEYCYGYVPPHGDLALERIGGTRRTDTLSNVTVVWVSTSGRFGFVIVGWYKNATVFRHAQRRGGSDYFVKAKVSDCTLLRVQERRFEIPRGGGGIGQSNRWYADQPSSRALKRRVLEYVRTRKLPGARKISKPSAGSKYQQDVKKRLQIEEKAMRSTELLYGASGYSVKRVHQDKLGWDLEATRGEELVRIEVKGCSGTVIDAELTPNEYVMMRRFRDSYHISIVLNALQKAEVRVFKYSPKLHSWYDDECSLQCKEVVAARLFI